MQQNALRLFTLQQKEKELIQKFDSILKVLQLICITSDWLLRLFCIVWVSSFILEITSRILS